VSLTVQIDEMVTFLESSSSSVDPRLLLHILQHIRVAFILLCSLNSVRSMVCFAQRVAVCNIGNLSNVYVVIIPFVLPVISLWDAFYVVIISIHQREVIAAKSLVCASLNFETVVTIWFTLWFTLCSPTSRSTSEAIGLSGLVHEEAHPTVPNIC